MGIFSTDKNGIHGDFILKYLRENEVSPIDCVIIAECVRASTFCALLDIHKKLLKNIEERQK